jgi:hypothetical protein
MNTPIEFKKQDFIKSVYSNKIYEVMEPDKKGMAILRNTETNRKENFNACNNPHFVKQENQIKLF